jgi:hypothetical protein
MMHFTERARMRGLHSCEVSFSFLLSFLTSLGLDLDLGGSLLLSSVFGVDVARSMMALVQIDLDH